MTFSYSALAPPWRSLARRLLLAFIIAIGVAALPVLAATEHVSEANLVLPDLGDVSLVTFLGGISGWTLLSWGLLVSLGGLVFGAVIYLPDSAPAGASLDGRSQRTDLRNLQDLHAHAGQVPADPGSVHRGDHDRLLLLRPAASRPRRGDDPGLFLVGIAGSFGVAWFGIRINTLANSRTAFASLAGKPYPVYAIPIKSGISIGMLLISTELLIMLCIMLFVPAALAGKCFIGFAIGESLGAAALRIAGGIFTKIADIGSDLMKIEFGIQEDDARNPG
jgi:K(+)-stimulated pyrophosphate-energized sodium pump